MSSFYSFISFGVSYSISVNVRAGVGFMGGDRKPTFGKVRTERPIDGTTEDCSNEKEGTGKYTATLLQVTGSGDLRL